MTGDPPHTQREDGVFSRLAKCLELTASNHDGEALAAVRKANRLRESLKVTWHDLLILPGRPEGQDAAPDYERMFAAIRAHNPLSEKWATILSSIEDFWRTRGYLTPKQARLVRKLYGTAMERRGTAA